jgi:tryptophanyl-tRNA synthetase
VLQCGDIVMYGEEGVPLYVPVGEDQVSHVELSREIVRRFNTHFGLQMDVDAMIANEADRKRLIDQLPAQRGEPFEEVVSAHRRNLKAAAAEWGIANFLDKMGESRKYFTYGEKLTEPQAMLTRTPRIPGTDGRKMSKSYGNAIELGESDGSIRAKTKVMITDPARKRRENPGNPDICPVYDWHKLFSPQQTLEWAAQGCRTAGIGCIECKSAMADHLIKWIAPVRARRQEYEKHPQDVLTVLDEGSKKARKVAQQTMARVREAVFGWQKKRAEIAGMKPGAKNVKVGN